MHTATVRVYVAQLATHARTLLVQRHSDVRKCLARTS
jgi:hypothetical protein